MQTLSKTDLMPLEQYAAARGDFRSKFMRYKKQRQFQLDDNIRFYFEDRITVQYQIQEMLRVEKIFEAEAIQEELDAYTPLISGENNIKATLMLEYPDVDERRIKLAERTGIEDTIWLQVSDFVKVMAIANEDLDRSTDEKTSSVHFLRFELSDEMVDAVLAGANITLGIDHPANRVSGVTIPLEILKSLRADLDNRVEKPFLQQLE
ncbi:DUF3501 family protein [Aliikangiella marina]|uniref:DUF3501 family protein n=1 Tax=Aliikangiella marina TaxID=1712262 RepID=A0A545T0Y4_9GAMM|nr:DUF3501 family protein [Aliikangiella marina]TQV70872.1 DUF3501 family protein [Aliikangiella marina]